MDKDSDIEKIIKDIYQLDPELREQDEEVRKIVATLLARRPEVVMTEEFSQQLRQRLLVKARTSFVKKSDRPFQFYLGRRFVYLTPVVAVAVLVIMLIPNQTAETPFPITPESSLETTREAVDATASRLAPASEDATTFNAFSVPAEPSDSFVLGRVDIDRVIAVEFVSVLEPSYLVVHVKRPDREVVLEADVIGISDLLLPTQVGSTTISLTDSLQSNTTYAVTLYRDNGDGLFDLGTDFITHNADANLPNQQFFTTPSGL